MESGEVFTLRHWPSILSHQRFHTGQQSISSWIEFKAHEVVRVIYKVNRKAYGIECLANQVPLALAILEYDPSGSSEHDIPMLLEIADTYVRSQFNGLSARDEVLARHSLHSPDRFLELTNERSLR